MRSTIFRQSRGRLLSLRRPEDVRLLLRKERSLRRAIPRQKYGQLSGREGNRHHRNPFNEVLDGVLPSHGARRTEQEVSLTQHEPAALALNMSHPPDRHVVTVEVTVHAWSADEATQVVRAFVTDVFARSEYKLGNIHAINAEPPSDETWHRALDCAGALG
jgi:hypothetical protein